MVKIKNAHFTRGYCRYGNYCRFHHPGVSLTKHESEYDGIDTIDLESEKFYQKLSFDARHNPEGISSETHFIKLMANSVLHSQMFMGATFHVL